MALTAPVAPNPPASHPPAPNPRRVAMTDVARLAGVSPQTVSRVANGFAGVQDATRAQVLAAMQELGYRPNSAARALKSGEFRAIGVIMWTLQTTGNMRTLEAITEAALEQGYAVTLLPPSPSWHEDGGFTRVGESIVDAVIVVMEHHQLDRAQLVLPTGVPIVVADTGLGERHPVVDNDQRAGARSAVDYLLGLGHTTVWHVTGPGDSPSAEQRRVAWGEVLHERDAPVPPVLAGDWSAASGRAAGEVLAEHWRAARDGATDLPMTAVFTANDQMAMGVLNALWRNNIRVPEDVSVVGFDDGPDSESFLPPLTTVHQDFGEVGRRLVLRVLSELSGGRRELGIDLVPTSLVVRESTAPPSVPGT